MEDHSILFTDWLEEHLENETDEYREEYENEKLKLELDIQKRNIWI